MEPQTLPFSCKSIPSRKDDLDILLDMLTKDANKAKYYKKTSDNDD